MKCTFEQNDVYKQTDSFSRFSRCDHKIVAITSTSISSLQPQPHLNCQLQTHAHPHSDSHDQAHNNIKITKIATTSTYKMACQSVGSQSTQHALYETASHHETGLQHVDEGTHATSTQFPGNAIESSDPVDAVFSIVSRELQQQT